jgi:hypothetical protein
MFYRYQGPNCNFDKTKPLISTSLAQVFDVDDTMQVAGYVKAVVSSKDLYLEDYLPAFADFGVYEPDVEENVVQSFSISIPPSGCHVNDDAESMAMATKYECSAGTSYYLFLLMLSNRFII